MARKRRPPSQGASAVQTPSRASRGPLRDGSRGASGDEAAPNDSAAERTCVEEEERLVRATRSRAGRAASAWQVATASREARRLARLAGRGGDHRTAITLLTSAIATHGMALENRIDERQPIIVSSHPSARAAAGQSSAAQPPSATYDDTRVCLARLFRHRALHQLHLLNYEECLADCRTSSRLFSSDAETHVIAALAHFHLRKFSDAADCLNSACTIRGVEGQSAVSQRVHDIRAGIDEIVRKGKDKSTKAQEQRRVERVAEQIHSISLDPASSSSASSSSSLPGASSSALSSVAAVVGVNSHVPMRKQSGRGQALAQNLLAHLRPLLPEKSLVDLLKQGARNRRSPGGRLVRAMDDIVHDASTLDMHLADPTVGPPLRHMLVLLRDDDAERGAGGKKKRKQPAAGAASGAADAEIVERGTRTAIRALRRRLRDEQLGKDSSAAQARRERRKEARAQALSPQAAGVRSAAWPCVAAATQARPAWSRATLASMPSLSPPDWITPSRVDVREAAALKAIAKASPIESRRVLLDQAIALNGADAELYALRAAANGARPLMDGKTRTDVLYDVARAVELLGPAPCSPRLRKCLALAHQSAAAAHAAAGDSGALASFLSRLDALATSLQPIDVQELSPMLLSAAGATRRMPGPAAEFLTHAAQVLDGVSDAVPSAWT